jgi:pimeloyl-ACP methyl ester carboxylesterase
LFQSFALRQFFLTNLVSSTDSSGAAHWRWQCNLDSIERHLSDIRDFPATDAHFDGPTLFVSGSKSNYVLKEDRALILKRFPNATFREIEGAGHWLHSEKPREFVEIVNQFLFVDDSG